MTIQPQPRPLGARVDPLKVNPVTESVKRLRAMSGPGPLTPAQQAVRDRGRAHVNALVASGLYSLDPKRSA